MPTIFDRLLGRTNKRSGGAVVGITLKDDIVITGYHSLADAPEVAAAVWRLADMLGTMTIHLWENSPGGNVRVKDALARKVDVDPWSQGIRVTLMQWIGATMFLSPRGEAFVLPITKDGQLEDLVPMPGAVSTRDPGQEGYSVQWRGQTFSSDDVLHFPLRPDPQRPWMGQGLQVQLNTVVQSILQTEQTKLDYMCDEYKPPLIIPVDSDSDLSDEAARERFIKQYMTRRDKREPLIIPGNLMNVQTVKPLSLTDLAIKDGVELDRKTVASIIGVPGFWLGVGSFDRDEHNTALSTTLKPMAMIIQQEMTRKLLVSPKRFFRLNMRSLYSYNLQELAEIAQNLYVRGIMTGNDVLDWIDMPPKDGLDQLVILENYIPAEMIAQQQKLIQEGKENE